MRVIAIKGPSRVGKTTVAQILRQMFKARGMNARVYEISQPLKEALPQAEGETKEAYSQRLLDLGAMWRTRFGDHHLARKVMTKSEGDLGEGLDYLLVPGVRGSAEANYIHEHGGFVLQIQADPETRASRMDGPARKGDLETRAYEGYYDVILNNDTTLKGLVDRINCWLTRWLKEG